MTIPKYTRDLTPHQIDLIAAMGRYGRVAAVCHELGLRPSTVKNELSTAYKKLGVPGIAGALWAVFIEPPHY